MPSISYKYAHEQILAPYACFASKTRGRKVREQEAEDRSPFQRDRDRIIHAAAFRRLEYKTQVFVNHEGDHFRTRLTHSLEVAQLSRTICRTLKLDEDLGEAIALSHDLGHPPFGHAGEDALNTAMQPFGGFDHNAQALKIITHLESKYAKFDGLNLTWECLEGVVKHNGPIKPKKGKTEIPLFIREYIKSHDLEIDTHPSLEAQISGYCDDIAYHNHDIEDGLRAHLFEVEDLLSLPLVGDVFREVSKAYPKLEESRLIHETKRRLIHAMASDLIATTERAIKASGVASVDDVRNFGKPLAAFSPKMQEANAKIKAFLHAEMYRHFKVNRMTSKAKRIVGDLFTFYMEEPECLPTDWARRIKKPGSQDSAIIISDYISGMTDRYAGLEHRRIFDLSYKVIGTNS